MPDMLGFVLAAAAALEAPLAEQQVELATPPLIDCAAPVGSEQSAIVPLPIPLRAIAGQPMLQSPLQLSIDGRSNGAAQGKVTLSDGNVLVSVLERAESVALTYTVLNASGCQKIKSIALVSRVNGPYFTQPANILVELRAGSPGHGKGISLSSWAGMRVGRNVRTLFGHSFKWLDYLPFAPPLRDEQCWKCSDSRWARMWFGHARSMSRRSIDEAKKAEAFAAGFENWAGTVEFFVDPAQLPAFPDNGVDGVHRTSEDIAAADRPALKTGVLLRWGNDSTVLAFQKAESATGTAIRISQLRVDGVLVYDEQK